MTKLMLFIVFIAFIAVAYAEDPLDFDDTDLYMDNAREGSFVTIQVNSDTGGGDLYHGGHDNVESHTYTVKTATTESAELLFGSDSFRLGLGCELQGLREIDVVASQDAKFGFDSIYMVSRLGIPFGANLGLELIGRWGYNEINHNDSYLEDIDTYYYSVNYNTVGGAMFGGGLGLVIGEHVVLQALYTEHHAETTVNYDSSYFWNDSYDMDIKYSQITLGIGARL